MVSIDRTAALHSTFERRRVARGGVERRGRRLDRYAGFTTSASVAMRARPLLLQRGGVAKLVVAARTQPTVPLRTDDRRVLLFRRLPGVPVLVPVRASPVPSVVRGSFVVKFFSRTKFFSRCRTFYCILGEEGAEGVVFSRPLRALSVVAQNKYRGRPCEGHSDMVVGPGRANVRVAES